ncbi:hypothetical protein [Sporocytophaga myxococcoides]|uniref:hypothetical protein n=1 Tax=Sporocytophaga myxococcoides TaxID=153721 RepID=UPI0004180266|nr:hypothetical protein [Sporocytophaga myxococcoides]
MSNSALQENKVNSLTVPSGYHRVACYIGSEKIGYLACSWDNFVYIEKDANSGKIASCKWCFDNSRRYLEKATAPFDRFLGTGSNSSAGWGLAGGGYVSEVVYNEADHTISLAGTNQKLYAPNGTGSWVYWTNGNDNGTIIKCILE